MLNQTNAMNTETWLGNLISKNTENKNIKILFSIITVFLGSLLLIASAKIKVPLYPVPMTLQPLAVMMIAMLFGGKLATLTVGLYILNIIDANVDAHLLQYNLDENLTLIPNIEFNEVQNTSNFGISLNIEL